MSESIKHEAVKGVAWTSIEKMGSQVIQVVLNIVLARLLTPKDYGVVAMTTIFTMIATTFIDSGFGNALIQKKEKSQADYSTCFWFNIMVGIGMYALFYISAPYIANFYRMPLLINVCRIIGLAFIFNSMTISQTAMLTVNLQFKQLSIVSISTQVFTGIFSIILAYNGWGVWALVFQIVMSSLIRLLAIEIVTRWIPTKEFCRDSFNHLFGFGSKLLCSNLINCIYSNIYALVIGRIYNANDVGYFNRANQFALLPGSSITEVVMKVAYPVMAKFQDDNNKLCNAYKKFLSLPLFVLWPILGIMVALAKPFIVVVIGEKWLPSVPYLQILALGAMFAPLTQINLNILFVKGRTDLVLRLEVIKKTIAFIILIVSIPFGIIWMVIGKAIYDLIA